MLRGSIRFCTDSFRFLRAPQGSAKFCRFLSGSPRFAAILSGSVEVLRGSKKSPSLEQVLEGACSKVLKNSELFATMS